MEAICDGQNRGLLFDMATPLPFLKGTGFSTIGFSWIFGYLSEVLGCSGVAEMAKSEVQVILIHQSQENSAVRIHSGSMKISTWIFDAHTTK